MAKILFAANTDWFLHNFRYALIHDLRDDGYDVVLLSPPGRFVTRFEEVGFHWLSWRLKQYSVFPWDELISFLHIFWIYRRERPDIVHHHTIKAVLYGSLAAYMVGIPHIVNSISGRGYVFLGQDFKARLIRRLIHPFYRFALRDTSSAVIFENQEDQSAFLQAGFVLPEHTWLIEGIGADPEHFSPTIEPKGPPVILMAARVLWDKGAGVFAEAARLLRERLRVRMVLVGEPDPASPDSVDQETLEAWHRDGLIEWWGWQQDMESVYRGCHIVALPTMYGEGVPRTLIEGAACGRPIVATDLPGCRAIVQHEVSGLLVPPNNPRSLAQALERLALDPTLRMQMGAEGRKLVLEKFTHEKVNQATQQVYQHLLGSKEVG